MDDLKMRGPKKLSSPVMDKPLTDRETLELNTALLQTTLSKLDMLVSDVVNMKANQQLFRLDIQALNSSMKRVLAEVDQIQTDCENLRKIHLLSIDIKNILEDMGNRLPRVD